MKKIIPILSLAVFTFFGAGAQGSQNKSDIVLNAPTVKKTNTIFKTSDEKKSTIVIIPGSWSSAADWGYVVPQLKATGYEVIVVNLPGHGTDKTSVASITLGSYVDAVKKAIGNKTNITLVAHSFGGVVLTQVAEEIPSQIKKLVYVAGYVPKNGESLLSLATADGDSHLGKVLLIKEKEGLAVVPKEGIVDAFFEDAPKQVQDYAADHFPVEPLGPLATPVKTTEANYGQLKKVFIFTANDHTNSAALQHKMVADNNITQTYTLPSSHTPFVSMPGVLAAIISNEAK